MDILVNSEIGYGVTADALRSQFAKVKDEDEVRIVINSPGGDIIEGIAMYNTIRDFARSHKNTITTYIQGMAASAASWLALAASDVDKKNKVVAEDNSVFMIHNGWGVVIGNKKDMRDTADLLESFDSLMRNMLAKKSGKSDEEIASLMDAETYFFGSEIKDAGFADEIIESKKPEENPEDPENPEEEEEKKKNALASSRKRVKDCLESLKNDASARFKEMKAVASAVKSDLDAEKARREKERIQSENALRVAQARKILSDCISK